MTRSFIFWTGLSIKRTRLTKRLRVYEIARSTRCPRNDGVLKERLVTSAEAEAWHAARAIETEASMRLSRNCRSGLASTNDNHSDLRAYPLNVRAS
jgi:hypothetical protein